MSLNSNPNSSLVKPEQMDIVLKKPSITFQKALQQARMNNKMSQKDLAKKLGTKQPAIARFESGAYNPTLSFLKKLSTALGGKLEIKI